MGLLGGLFVAHYKLGGVGHRLREEGICFFGGDHIRCLKRTLACPHIC